MTFPSAPGPIGIFDSGYGGLLAEAFLLGAGAAGKETFRLDAPLAAAAAAAAPIWGLDTVLFVRQEGSALTLRFFDADGLPLSRKSQRTLEAAGNGESPAALREGCAAARTLRGTAELWISDALRGCGELKGLRVACDGPILSGAFRRGRKLAEGLGRLPGPSGAAGRPFVGPAAASPGSGWRTAAFPCRPRTKPAGRSPGRSSCALW